MWLGERPLPPRLENGSLAGLWSLKLRSLTLEYLSTLQADGRHTDDPRLVPLETAKRVSKGENENKTLHVFSKAGHITQTFKWHTELLITRALKLSLLLGVTDEEPGNLGCSV